MSDSATRAGAAVGGGAGVSPWLIAMLVALAAFMEVLDTTVANVLIDYIAGGLAVSEDEASWVVTTYLVANAVALTASSFLTRRFGRKRFFLVCLGLFTASSVMCAYAWIWTRCCCSGSSRGSAAAAWCRWRSRSSPIPFRRRSAPGFRAVWRRRGCGAGRRPDTRRLAGGQHYLALGIPDQWPGWSDNDGAHSDGLVLAEGRRCWTPTGAAAGRRVRSPRLHPGLDLSRRAGDCARPRPHRRLVRFILYHDSSRRLRARLCADDPVGSEPAQPDDRSSHGGDAPVRRLLCGDVGDRRRALWNHSIPPALGTGGFRLHGNLGGACAGAPRSRYDGDVRRCRSLGGQGPAQTPHHRRCGIRRTVDGRPDQCLWRPRLLVLRAIADMARGRSAADLYTHHHRVL